jgi:tetratricopeptide (TPR) repeat protein
MRTRLIPLIIWALAAMLLTAGCGRYDASPFTAEIDEPSYRRGKDLLRQGRNPEALAEFLKVIDKRGNDAPESHLEAGILYQQHIKDPITAIYHYKKFRELKRNSPQSDLVRQRIDAATREFARTLPAQPLENQMERLDLLEKIDQLQRENVQLKDQLIGVRTQAINSPRVSSATPPPVAEVEDLQAPLAIDTTQSPIAAAPDEALSGISVSTQTPVAPPAQTLPVPTVRAPQPTTPAAQVGGRRYVVQKGDSLFAIAKSQYGSATNARVQGILNANRAQLPSASALKPGMVLVIP